MAQAISALFLRMRRTCYPHALLKLLLDDTFVLEPLLTSRVVLAKTNMNCLSTVTFLLIPAGSWQHAAPPRKQEEIPSSTDGFCRKVPTPPPLPLRAIPAHKKPQRSRENISFVRSSRKQTQRTLGSFRLAPSLVGFLAGQAALLTNT